MASKTSILGTLTLGGTAIIEVIDLQITAQGQEIQKPVACLDTAPTSTAVFGTAGGAIKVNLDLADAQHRSLGVASTGALVWRPEGAGSGKPEFTGTITLSSKTLAFGPVKYHEGAYNFTGALTAGQQT